MRCELYTAVHVHEHALSQAFNVIDIILFQEEIEAEKNRICEYFKTGEGKDVQLTSLYLQINPTRFVLLKLWIIIIILRIA